MADVECCHDIMYVADMLHVHSLEEKRSTVLASHESVLMFVG